MEAHGQWLVHGYKHPIPVPKVGYTPQSNLHPELPTLLLLLLSRFSCVRLRNPIDGSPLGSPVPGILQATALEWVAISFSNA